MNASSKITLFVCLSGYWLVGWSIWSVAIDQQASSSSVFPSRGNVLGCKAVPKNFKKNCLKYVSENVNNLASEVGKYPRFGRQSHHVSFVVYCSSTSAPS